MSNNNDDLYPSAKRQRKEAILGNFQPKPSYVVHLRNLNEIATESMVLQELEVFGQINEIMLLPKKRQALIEYDDITSAIACVDESNEKNIFINGTPCYINYSTSQKIIKNDQDEKKVLLINVLSPLYPITVKVMHTICMPFGKILRILIFRKNGVQVMIEFESPEGAAKAKEELDGADIYSGCCTLNIEFAKTSRLNVLNNDEDSCDFTLIDTEPSKKPLLQIPTIKNGNQPTPYHNQEQKPNQANYNNNQSATSNNNHNQGYVNKGVQSKGITSLMSLSETQLQPAETSGQRTGMNGQIVLSAHNLCPLRFNCDRLFNLLSLYGNVDKIKFLLSKEGSAMLQMSNAKPLYDVITHLNNTNIFGRRIQVHVGKQTVLQPVLKPVNLKDETSSYKEYMTSRNNRYQTIEAAQKNKPLAPSNVLYWYNAPPGIVEDQILNVFETAGAPLPSKVKIFPKKIDKSSTGLVEWNNISDCVESLILANHTEINHPSSKFPFIFKLCFSATPISKRTFDNNSEGQKRPYTNSSSPSNNNDDSNSFTS